YPGLAGPKKEFLTKQLVSITLQQAEKDYKIAEFYERTGHPGSAYFYYELVCRRYQGTKYADLAKKKKDDLEKKKGDTVLPPDSKPGPAQPSAPTPALPETAPVPRPQPPMPETAPPPRALPPGLTK